MMRKITAALCVCAIALGLLTGCGKTEPASSAPSAPPSSSAPASSSSAPAPSSSEPEQYVPDWRVEPYLTAARIAGMPEDVTELNQQAVFSHLGIQVSEGGGWQFLNFETGEVFPDQQSTDGVWATIDGKLPFFDGGNFNFGMDYDALGAWVEQLSEEQGIGFDYMGHGGVNNYPPVLVNGEWFQYFQFPEGLSPFTDESPLEFSGEANVALILDVNNEKWQEGDSYTPWMYVGPAGGSDYDGVILVDRNGERITDAVYEEGMPYSDGVAAVRQNGKWGYVDETGTPVTEFVYEPLLSSDTFSREALVPYSAHEGLIPVMKDGKCGVIDTQGNEVVPCIFDGITSVYDGAVWAKQNGQWGVLNVA